MVPPPCASSTSNEVHPSSAPRRQKARSNPAASSRRRRNSSGGACSTRNRSVVWRKNSWSSLGAISIAFGGPLSRLASKNARSSSGPRSNRADAGGLVALAPLVARHPGDVHVTRPAAQGAHRRLCLRRVHERVPVVEAAGVLPGDHVDLCLVGDAGPLE